MPPPPPKVWFGCFVPAGLPRAPLGGSALGCAGLAQLRWTSSRHDLLESQSLCVCDTGEGDTAPGKSELGGVLSSLPCAESREVLVAGRHRMLPLARADPICGHQNPETPGVKDTE